MTSHIVDLSDLGIVAATISRILTEHWASIAARVTPDLLPREAPNSSPSWRIPEIYGCGHYGCVMPTSTAGVVVKMTTDPSEALFIERARELGPWPEGIVKYFDLLALPTRYFRRPVFLIWREEAHRVGMLLVPGRLAHEDDFLYEERNWFGVYLLAFAHHAGRIRQMLRQARDPQRLLQQAVEYEDWAFRYVDIEQARVRGHRAIDSLRGARALAARLRACEIIAEYMMGLEYGGSVGEALDFYLKRGLLLADVHGGNVGEVYRDGRWIVVITDPGHVLDLQGIARGEVAP